MKSFFDTVGLSHSIVYFITNLFKFLSKDPALKQSCLSSHYFTNNFKSTNQLCKENENSFGKKMILK